MTDPYKMADYERYMDLAIAQAQAAADAGDVPIGAVIVRGGVVLAAAGNRRIIDADPTAHAEMLAIRAAAKAIGGWRLDGCAMFVTLEPCCMCAGAIVLARMERLVYGQPTPRPGPSRHCIASATTSSSIIASRSFPASRLTDAGRCSRNFSSPSGQWGKNRDRAPGARE